MNQEHLVELSKQCRVCGSFFKKKKGSQNRRISCSDRRADLLEVFKIDIDQDMDDIHPQCFCHLCNNIIYHTKKKASDGKPYYPTITITTWSAQHERQACRWVVSLRRTRCAHAQARYTVVLFFFFFFN